MTDFAHRAFIIVDNTKLVAANAKAAAWDPDTGGGETFGEVRLSANGQEPSTHTACSTAATDGMKTAVLDAQGNVPFIAVYWAADGWTWQTALADAGLQLIEEAP